MISIGKWVENMKTEGDTTVLLFKLQDIVDSNKPKFIQGKFFISHNEQFTARNIQAL